MEWTHSICDNCWKKRDPDREPVRFLLPPEERCCFCGRLHKSGVYIRHDPKELKCGGKHE